MCSPSPTMRGCLQLWESSAWEREKLRVGSGAVPVCPCARVPVCPCVAQRSGEAAGRCLQEGCTAAAAALCPRVSGRCARRGPRVEERGLRV